MGKKYTFESKVEAYVQHKEGVSLTELSFARMVSKKALANDCSLLGKRERELRPIFEGKPSEEKAGIRGIVSFISSNSLSLEAKSALVQGLGMHKYRSWYLAWRTGMLDEAPNNQEDMEEPKRKKKLSAKDIKDEKDRRIYWLELENAFLKKKIEIREQMEKEARSGKGKSGR